MLVVGGRAWKHFVLLLDFLFSMWVLHGSEATSSSYLVNGNDMVRDHIMAYLCIRLHTIQSEVTEYINLGGLDNIS
jgi:hypothetical protein